MAEDRQDKKNLITEKITGRRLTPARVVRNIVLALLLGALFGLSAGAVFIAVMNLRESGKGSDYVNAFAEIPYAEPETETPPEETPAPETEIPPEETPAPETEDESESETGETEEESESETGETEEESESEPFSRASLIATLQESLVRISATTAGTTWFESEVLSTETFSGVILRVSDEEILILAPDSLRDKDALRAEFAGGISADVYIKSFSVADGLCILAAEGMDESVGEGIRALETAGEESKAPGTELIAIGSPLSVAGSYAFGDISYVGENEAGYDVSQTVIYADIRGDGQAGTFIVDLRGELIGVASKEGESAVGGDALRIVSIESLKDTLNKLMAGESLPYIGIKAQAVSFDMRYSGIPDGCYVTDVDSASPAYAAGLKRGDIVTSINGETLSDMAGYEEALRKAAPGDVLTLNVMRLSGSDYRELEFTLEAGTR